MATKTAQNPLILHFHRLMEAFSKSDDEKDFYVNRREGYIIFIDLDRDSEELERINLYLRKNPDEFCVIPKLTFYETKKIMENFVNEKVFDIDTKEKVMDIIQSKEARDNFLEFIYDHHNELEKWQQFYAERFRVRIIEWLRTHEFIFAFEEDLELANVLIEKVKKSLFTGKVGKDVTQARSIIEAKSKTYYSNEALNPRPKRGRPPKQQVKVEVDTSSSSDIFHFVTSEIRPFLFTPDINGVSSITFSSRFDNEAELLANMKRQSMSRSTSKLEEINEKLQSLRSLSNRVSGVDLGDSELQASIPTFNDSEDDASFRFDFDEAASKRTSSSASRDWNLPSETVNSDSPARVVEKSPAVVTSKASTAKTTTKKAASTSKASAAKTTTKKASTTKAPTKTTTKKASTAKTTTKKATSTKKAAAKKEPAPKGRKPHLKKLKPLKTRKKSGSSE